MNATVAERKARIKELACAAFEIDGDQLTETALFDEDLGIDSLSIIDLLAALEKAFGVDIEQAGASRLVSLDAVYQVVAELSGWPAAEDQLASS